MSNSTTYQSWRSFQGTDTLQAGDIRPNQSAYASAARYSLAYISP